MPMSEERRRALLAKARETEEWTEEAVEAAVDEISTWPMLLELVRLYKECPPND